MVFKKGVAHWFKKGMDKAADYDLSGRLSITAPKDTLALNAFLGLTLLSKQLAQTEGLADKFRTNGLASFARGEDKNAARHKTTLSKFVDATTEMLAEIITDDKQRERFMELHTAVKDLAVRTFSTETKINSKVKFAPDEKTLKEWEETWKGKFNNTSADSSSS